MALQIEGALFKIDEVKVSEGASARCAMLQKRARKLITNESAISVHSGILLKFHAMGDFGNILPSDRIVNRNNIAKNEGRVLSVIGDKYPFVIITNLPDGDTYICIPEEL